MKIRIPCDVEFILDRLIKNKYEAFVVGGCVRDSILGKEPHDWDICTNAKPEQIKVCFAEFSQIDAGMKHGTISVVINNEAYEITTYRIDGKYRDNRHPENVIFTNDITQDLSRRDFTINAMAYNEQSGLIDPYGGYSDAKKGIIKCVGQTEDRFNEDALRIIRAIRFASVYDFKIETNTSKAIHKCRNLLQNIAIERITSELLKLICGCGAENVLNEYRDVIAVFIPELSVMFDYDQHNVNHSKDLWRHTTKSVGNIISQPVLRMTMLLHDLGKPECRTVGENGEWHYFGHPRKSREIAEKILCRLKLSNDFISECLVLVEYHDMRYSGVPCQLKRMLNKIGEKNLKDLLKIQRADILAQSEYERSKKLIIIDKAENNLNKILDDNACFSRSNLAVNGRDIISIGVTQGKQIGKILDLLLELVIEDKAENSYEALINLTKQLIENNKI